MIKMSSLSVEFEGKDIEFNRVSKPDINFEGFEILCDNFFDNVKDWKEEIPVNAIYVGTVAKNLTENIDGEIVILPEDFIELNWAKDIVLNSTIPFITEEELCNANWCNNLETLIETKGVVAPLFVIFAALECIRKDRKVILQELPNKSNISMVWFFY